MKYYKMIVSVDEFNRITYYVYKPSHTDKVVRAKFAGIEETFNKHQINFVSSELAYIRADSYKQAVAAMQLRTSVLPFMHTNFAMFIT